MQREKEERAGGPGFVWMSSQSAKMGTRGRWSDLNREHRGVMNKANGSLRLEYWCVELERKTERTRR